MPLLAIETTCDETAAAVISRSRIVLSSVVSSQGKLHERWRGVVPELASRAHVERILPVIDEAITLADITRSDIEAVAVATAPGLVGSLLVGLAAAKGIAATLNCPIVGYDHIAAHLYACRLTYGAAVRYPCVGLVASGGHTTVFHVRGPFELDYLGGTIDDAAGEAFDKAACMLGLGYPGGPEIERIAATGDPNSFRLPRPLASDRNRFDLSFSGLKTALRFLVQPPGVEGILQPPGGQLRADLAASFQQAVTDSILAKVELAISATGCSCLIAGGGVVANKLLRESLVSLGRRRGVDLFIPPPSLCTDNAAMGAIAWERLERGDDDGLLLDVRPGRSRPPTRLSSVIPPSRSPS